MGLRPFDDLARPDDRLALVQGEHREIDLAGELAHLVAAALAVPPRPGHQPIAGEVADLVLVAGLIEGLGRAAAGVSDRCVLFPLAARVEDHAASLSRRASTSGTCLR